MNEKMYQALVDIKKLSIVKCDMMFDYQLLNNEIFKICYNTLSEVDKENK